VGAQFFELIVRLSKKLIFTFSAYFLFMLQI